MYRKYRKHKHNANSGTTLLVLIVFMITALITSLYFSQGYSVDSLIPMAVILSIFVIASGCGILLYIYQQQQRALKAIEVSDIDNMTGIEFERYLGNLLKSQGYKIAFTRVSGDFGTDIVAKLNHDTYSVQAKRYTHSVDRSAISDAVAAMKVYGCNKSMVITSNYFTAMAKQFGRMNQCVLIDRNELAKWIVTFQRDLKTDVSLGV